MRSFRTMHRLRAVVGMKLPFTTDVPPDVQGALLLQQVERLRAYLPVLCLVIAANALAMAIAVLGDLPWWQQFTPPFLIISVCLAVLARTGRTPATTDPARALQILDKTTLVAGGLGLVAGAWGVNAFIETERYYCMVAPVFIGIAALVSATCLFSAPRAAIVGMIATVVPVVVKMASFDNMGVRAMAAMMVLVIVMQAGVVVAKFRETVGIMVMQHELNRLAATDALTGLDNRFAFMGKLRAGLAAGTGLRVLLSDLDGFKAANDRHGHLAGDAILIEVAARLRRLVPHAVSIARLGGDEFALLFEGGGASDVLPTVPVEALRAAISLPVSHAGDSICVGASFGMATSPLDGTDEAPLIHAADLRLYADKAARRQSMLRRTAA